MTANISIMQCEKRTETLKYEKLSHTFSVNENKSTSVEWKMLSFDKNPRNFRFRIHFLREIG